MPIAIIALVRFGPMTPTIAIASSSGGKLRKASATREITASQRFPRKPATSAGTTPITNPTISNITLCGQHSDKPKQQYGFLFRRGFHANVMNAFVTGFEAGVDFRNTPDTAVTLTNSVMVGNTVNNVAYPETDPATDDKLPTEDDDGGFDEIAWFTEGTGNSETGAIGDCWAATPDPAPATTIPGGTPSGSGFDASANYVGAFKDKSDTWMTGAWIDWSAN